jgi:hypothetical protein
VNWIELHDITIADFCEHGNEPLWFLKVGFFSPESKYQLLRKTFYHAVNS